MLNQKSLSLYMSEIPKKALIEVGTGGTVLSAADEHLASRIFEATENILESI